MTTVTASGARHFLGIDLGGGKGKTTALAHLRLSASEPGRLEVLQYGLGSGAPWYDRALVDYVSGLSHEAVLAIDAPLTLPACVRCQLPVCPGTDRCDVPTVKWFRDRALLRGESNKKPFYTPYTQRAADVLLQEERQIVPRETLGQGMGPLTARATYLVRSLATHYRLHENLIEVFPRATLSLLFGAQIAARYKRSGLSAQTRLGILARMENITFLPGVWRERAVSNDHAFDALLCAYTAYLFSTGQCDMPATDLQKEDGWIYIPNAPGKVASD